MTYLKMESERARMNLAEAVKLRTLLLWVRTSLINNTYNKRAIIAEIDAGLQHEQTDDGQRDWQDGHSLDFGDN